MTEKGHKIQLSVLNSHQKYDIQYKMIVAYSSLKVSCAIIYYMEEIKHLEAKLMFADSDESKYMLPCSK